MGSPGPRCTTNGAAVRFAATSLLEEAYGVPSHRPGGCPRGVPPPPFAAFVDAYFDSLYAYAPSLGTAAGLHQYDSLLENRSAATITRRVTTLTAQRARLDSLRAGRLATDDSIDAGVLAGAIRAELLELEVIQSWRKNPMGYVGLAGNAVDLLMKRRFAPPVARLRLVTARLRGVPALLAAMRANVANPPREFTDLAIRIAGGSVGFFRDDVAKWARESAGTDSAALRAFTLVNDSVVSAMAAAAAWLKTDLLPRSQGTFAIGARAFADKLRYEEMIEIPLDRLLALGEATLDKDHQAFLVTAQEIAPGATPQQAMAALEADHPSAATLLPSTRATLEGTRQFLIDHKIVDLPSEVRPIVAETPPYARVGTFASMDTPGAYEQKATEAFYYVTPPEADWDAAHVEEHLRLYNSNVMSIITIHEAFPGHYLQFIYAKQFPTKTRKLLYANTNAEGWAHYGEQMMVEEGFGNGNPRIRLAQLIRSVATRLPLGGRDQRAHAGSVGGRRRRAVLHRQRCFQQPANAYEEARRGAYDPTYLYYTLGKLAIYKLREDYRRAKGSAFSLREFHDQFVRQGGVPIPLIRRILLPGDTAAVLN